MRSAVCPIGWQYSPPGTCRVRVGARASSGRACAAVNRWEAAQGLDVAPAADFIIGNRPKYCPELLPRNIARNRRLRYEACRKIFRTMPILKSAAGATSRPLAASHLFPAAQARPELAPAPARTRQVPGGEYCQPIGQPADLKTSDHAQSIIRIPSDPADATSQTSSRDAETQI